MAPKTDGETFSSTLGVAVDVFIEHGMGLKRRPSSEAAARFAIHREMMDQGDDRPPPYRARKIRPDKQAIANLHTLQKNRPLKPPGRS